MSFAGFEDDYVLEDIEVALSDHVNKCLKANFGAAWDSLATDSQEVEETFALSSVSTVPEAVANIVSFMGMQVCGNCTSVTVKFQTMKETV